MLNNGIKKRREVASITERAASNCIKYFSQVRVKPEIAVEMSVAKLFDIFRQIAEEENVLLSNLSGDLDLHTG